MPEPTSFFGIFKSFFGIFGSIAKEVIKRYNQPKLAIKSVFINKRRNSYTDTIRPFNIPSQNIYPTESDMQALTRQHQKYVDEMAKYEEAIKLSRQYTLEWNYEMTLTNNSEHTAYKLKLIEKISNTWTSEADYTKPIPANQSVTHTLTIRESVLATKPEADKRLAEGIPFSIQVEYSNVKGTRYFTLYNSEAEVEQQNQFGRVK